MTRKSVLVSAMVGAIIVLFTCMEASAALGDGTCQPDEVAKNQCVKLGGFTLETIPSTQGQFPIPATCSGSPCSVFPYFISPNPASNQLSNLVPQGFLTVQPSGCTQVYTGGTGDPSGFGKNIAAFDVCRITSTANHAPPGITFPPGTSPFPPANIFIATTPAVAGLMSVQLKVSNTIFIGDILGPSQWPGGEPPPLAPAAETITTSKGASLTVQLNPQGQVTSATGSGTPRVIQATDTVICVVKPGVSSPQFPQDYICDTILFVAGSCRITTVLEDPYYLIGGSGAVTSSVRFKDDVRALGERSHELLRLHPVTFRYKPEYGDANSLQYGLLAEEVAEVLPELAVNDAHGQPVAVRYNFLPVLLLNELQRQEREQAALQAEIAALRATLEALQVRLRGAAPVGAGESDSDGSGRRP